MWDTCFRHECVRVVECACLRVQQLQGQAGTSPNKQQPIAQVGFPAWTSEQGYKVADVGAGYLHSYALLCKAV